jgi:hypothetical protein
MAATIEAVNGSPRYKGTISATSTVATLAVTAGRMYLLQSDAAVYVHGATSAGGAITKADNTSTTLTAALGVKLAADEKAVVTLRGEEGYVAAITSTGSASVKVFELEPA